MFFLPRLMIRLFVFLVVLIAILVGINYGVQVLAQDELASHIKSATQADKVTVHVGSFPILYELAAENKVHDVDVVADGVPVGDIKLTSVTVSATGISLNHHQMFSDHRLQVTSITNARITVVFTLSGLAAVAATDLAHVSVGPHDELLVTVAGHTVYSVRLSSTPIVPDCPLILSDIPGGYSLTCVVAPVPSTLIAVLTTH
jgi:hypothetical protein